jgi:hypothetical protein
MIIQQMKTTPIPILGLSHIGIRVHNLERSVRFYELLGFTKTAGPIGPEPAAILDHPSGAEVNLVLNALNASERNILMDTREASRNYALCTLVPGHQGCQNTRHHHPRVDPAARR